MWLKILKDHVEEIEEVDKDIPTEDVRSDPKDSYKPSGSQDTKLVLDLIHFLHTL